MNNFYPEVKKNLSPTAVSMWLTAPSGFRKMYFDGERIESHILREGTRIHDLAEKGFVKLKKVMPGKEVKQEIKFSDTLDFKFTLDAYEGNTFVDYKTQAVDVKEPWTQTKTNKDVKQLANAWALWELNGRKDKEIIGSIEAIIVKDVEGERIPTGDTHVFTKTYTEKELMEFPSVLNKMIEDVNEAYVKHQSQTDLFIEEDLVKRYAELKGQENGIKAEMDEIKTQINEQMEKGNVLSHKTDFGSFSRSARKTYSYPTELTEAEAEVKAKKKDYEMKNEPEKISYTLSFRAK